MGAAHLRQEAIRNFEEACAPGDIDTVTSIINEKKNPCDLESGLCIAIWSEKLDVARFLLEKETPISLSVSNAATNRAKKTEAFSYLDLLAEYGWDINTPNRGGESILMYVVPLLTSSYLATA
jgi:hypothetical protein